MFKSQDNPYKTSSIGNQRKLIFLLVFLFTLHLTPATYIESNFLQKLIGDERVGLIYSLASIFSLMALVTIRKLVRVVGNFRVYISALIVELISMLILGSSMFMDSGYFSHSVLLIAFILGFIARGIVFFNFDIFLEHLSNDRDTGSIRGSYLTASNIPFVIGPIIAGMILVNNEQISNVFFLGVLILLPVIYLSFIYFNKYKDTIYKQYPVWDTFKYILRHPDLRNIFTCNFLLYFFYGLMIIYAPLFLYENIGFSLSDVVIITGIALLPFVLLQYYLGFLADRKFGEKEILTIGFIIMGLSTIMMSLFSAKIFLLWVVILFITRIGASMVESMVEIYLFKKIDDDSLDIIGLYRSIRPTAYIIAPMIASIIVIFWGLNWIFLFLGAMMLLGTIFSLRIKDTL